MKLVYYFDTGWACGQVTVEDGIIQNEGTAPIFRNMTGQSFAIVLSRGKRYKAKKLTSLKFPND